MAKAPTKVAQIQAPRKGEGFEIDVIHGVKSNSADSTAVQVGLSLNDAPVPTRRYVADIGAVVMVRGEVKLIFGQERFGTDELRSMLILQMSELAARQFLESFSPMSPSLSSIAQTMGTEPSELVPGMIEPNQAASFAVNFAAAAIVGDEACLDFYHASPFSMRSLQFVKKLPVEPVVRVDLRLSLLLAITNELARLKPTMKPIAGENRDAGL